MYGVGFYLGFPILFHDGYGRLLPECLIPWLVTRVPVVVEVQDIGVEELQDLSLEVFSRYFFSFDLLF